MLNIEIIENQKVPYDLLYLADEDDDQIGKYKDSAIFFAARQENKIAGTLGLNEISADSVEIVSVAVYEEYQNKKIGTELVDYAIQYSKEKKYKEIIIKTGDCGIKQLYLYQRCGFRFDSINKDYFTQFYKTPIYEDTLRCIHQIILKYTIFSDDEIKRSIEEFWNSFIANNPEFRNKKYEVWKFGYGDYLADKLLCLVREGKKKGTTSALEMYEGSDEKIPEEGDISIVTYGNGLPACIIETKELTIKKFKEITEEEARIEGEGDLSLEYWRKAHEWFFKQEYREQGKEFSNEIPVIFERFEVLYDIDRKI